MEKYITDEQTGLEYELVGDYYLLAGDDEPEEEMISQLVKQMAKDEGVDEVFKRRNQLSWVSDLLFVMQLQ